MDENEEAGGKKQNKTGERVEISAFTIDIYDQCVASISV